MSRLCALILCILLAGCAGHGPRLARPAEPAPFEQRLFDQRFATAAEAAGAELRAACERHNLPSLTAAVSVDGKLVWAAAMGWADVAARRPATIATRYRIGSTSKAVTATGLARLVDAGVMTLDRPIGDWAKDLPNAAWNQLTPRQLASHTAGIVSYEQNRDLLGLWQSIRETRRFDSVAEALSVFDGNKLKYPPGTGFEYSSFDIVLLSRAMEAAAGRPWPELMAERVFAPAGVAGVSPDWRDHDIPGRATFYWRKGDRWRAWRRVDHSYKWAGGGLVASSAELALIGGRWFDPGFIRPETRTAFWEPQRLADGRVNEQYYAIGWRSHPQTRLLGPDRPVHNVHHGGVSKGAMSWLNLYPEWKVAIAINANARFDDFADLIALERPITRAFVDVLEPGLDGQTR